MDELWDGEPHEFFRAVKEGAHLFQGITDATLSHGEGWRFIQLGRYLERASATAALPGRPLQPAARRESLDYLELVGLLQVLHRLRGLLQGLHGRRPARARP